MIDVSSSTVKITGLSEFEAKLQNQKKDITTNDVFDWLSQHSGNYVRYIADVYGDYYWDVSAKIAEE